MSSPSAAPAVPSHFISVVIIARNEQRTISACLLATMESLAEAMRAGKAVGGEVLLVDSASSDATVEIARKFPITILQLAAHWPLSAAAGRQAGLENSRGDLVFFVDGDSVPEPAWLLRALDLIELPGVAVVSGTVLEAQHGQSMLAREIDAYVRSTLPREETVEIEVASTGLYRRTSLDSVSGFHPFLKGAEDLDLCLRIRRRGLKILQTRSLMAYHHWSSDAKDVRLVDYLRSVAAWSYGSGQACRYRFADSDIRRRYLGRYVSARFAWEYLRGLLLTIFVLGQVIFLARLPFGIFYLVVIDLVAAAVLFAVKWQTNRTWMDLVFSMHRIAYAIVRHAGFASGLMSRIQNPDKYPRPPSIVQAGRQFGLSGGSVRP